MSIDRFAVIGDPIDHSLSPVMQRAAFEAAGIEAVYEAHHVSPAMLRPHVACLRYGYRGFNVTVPHKEAILSDLDEIAPEARAVGAVNTVAVCETRLTGFNTDGVGFGKALASVDEHPEGLLAVVFGAGGSARSVVGYLAGEGAQVLVVNRSVERARALAAVFHDVEVAAPEEARVREALEQADLVVNATSLGMSHLASLSPLPATASLCPGAVAVDLVYGGETPFLRAAGAAGCRTLDGIEMLVQQGAESIRIWRGVEADVNVMRQACRRELERRQCSVS